MLCVGTVYLNLFMLQANFVKISLGLRHAVSELVLDMHTGTFLFPKKQWCWKILFLLNEFQNQWLKPEDDDGEDPTDLHSNTTHEEKVLILLLNSQVVCLFRLVSFLHSTPPLTVNKFTCKLNSTYINTYKIISQHKDYIGPAVLSKC